MDTEMENQDDDPSCDNEGGERERGDFHSDMEEEVDVGSPQDENPLMQMDSKVDMERAQREYYEEQLRKELLKKITENTAGSPLATQPDPATLEAMMMVLMRNAVGIDFDANKTMKASLDNNTKCNQCDFVVSFVLVGITFVTMRLVSIAFK